MRQSRRQIQGAEARVIDDMQAWAESKGIDLKVMHDNFITSYKPRPYELSGEMHPLDSLIWTLIDCPADDFSVADQYANECPAEAKEMAASIASAKLRAYRVVSAKPGKAITLRDLLTDEVMETWSDNVSREVTPGELLFARVRLAPAPGNLVGSVRRISFDREPWWQAQLISIAAREDNKGASSADLRTIYQAVSHNAPALLLFNPPKADLFSMHPGYIDSGKEQKEPIMIEWECISPETAEAFLIQPGLLGSIREARDEKGQIVNSVSVLQYPEQVEGEPDGAFEVSAEGILTYIAETPSHVPIAKRWAEKYLGHGVQVLYEETINDGYSRPVYPSLLSEAWQQIFQTYWQEYCAAWIQQSSARGEPITSQDLPPIVKAQAIHNLIRVADYLPAFGIHRPDMRWIDKYRPDDQALEEELIAELPQLLS